jgi:hypothetical protein
MALLPMRFAAVHPAPTDPMPRISGSPPDAQGVE